jgi:hypothetical protein
MKRDFTKYYTNTMTNIHYMIRRQLNKSQKSTRKKQSKQLLMQIYMGGCQVENQPTCGNYVNSDQDHQI